MANYPPPPPGGGYAPGPPPPHLVDPYAGERALRAWAEARGYALVDAPDLAWYRAWFPFAFLPPVARVGRELRATFHEASVWLVEAFEGDAIKQAAGEDRHLLAFLTSPRLVYRAAIRSRVGGGIVNEIGRGLGDLFGSGPRAGGVLGDPTFEGRFEVAIPTRDEGSAALPIALRHLLLQTSWSGVLEVRAGGLACAMYGRSGFDPVSLDGSLAVLGQIYAGAVSYDHPVTAPPGM